ncbi:MAG: nickel pincer cofactor biosynthesis protein LarC [Ignavibacteriales bacterium]|nr:nickel pincer cofactor biosynthesis protein LarC [Ignavibacteriales bacterium]
MKAAYFDTIGGISGDMTLGAFVNAGVDFQELVDEVKKLKLNNVELEASHVSCNGIDAVKVDVIVSLNQHHHHRGIKEINEIIDASTLTEEIKKNAKKIFATLANAEAKVHGTTVDKIHFHEVGAVDSIVDIVGTAICLDKLDIKTVYSSPIKLGSGGIIIAEHGTLPNPAPATIEILQNYPVVFTEIPYELATPTGAAIIKSLSIGVLGTRKFTPTIVGYGAGSRKIKEIPNLLRIVIGEIDDCLEDNVYLIETNIDDMNPEIYPYIIELLLENQALDAFLTPTIMKKGRPGTILSVLCYHSEMNTIRKLLLSETSTLGFRIQECRREKVERYNREVITEFGLTKVKVAKIDGYERIFPEFEECKQLARQTNLPLIEVYKRIEAEIHRIQKDF